MLQIRLTVARGDVYAVMTANLSRRSRRSSTLKSSLFVSLFICSETRFVQLHLTQTHIQIVTETSVTFDRKSHEDC